MGRLTIVIISYLLTTMAFKQIKQIKIFLESLFKPNHTHFTFRFLWIIMLLLLPLQLVSAVISQKVLYQGRAVGAEPSFKFSPSSLTVNPSDTFTVDVEMASGGQTIGGAAIQISFDSQSFQVLRVTPGNQINQSPAMLANILKNEFDNQRGLIKLDAGVAFTNPQYYSGEGIFARIQFKALDDASLGNHTIAFFWHPDNPQALGDCDLIAVGENLGQDILQAVTPLTVNIIALPTPTLPPATGCSQRGGICCLPQYGTHACLERKISPYSDPTSGGCDPGNTQPWATKAWCCGACHPNAVIQPGPAVTATPTSPPIQLSPTPTTAAIPSPGPTSPPVASPTSAPPAVTECEQQGWVCCGGNYGSCVNRKINPWRDPTSGGCSPSGVWNESWCCEKCR